MNINIFNPNAFIKRSTLVLLLLGSFISILFFGCAKKFPEEKNISEENYVLLNQDSSRVNFPADYKGKILVMTFIYTNCPDICPMTTHNMQLVQEQIAKSGIGNVQFAALTFDPTRDTPTMLKEYAQVRNINLQNFQFLTGDKKSIKAIIKEFNVIAIPGDTTLTDDKKPLYFYIHTDRIVLIDQNGIMRKEYRGSHIDKNELISDIKSLED
ncbi:MAG: SCO family protein [Ignavibacteriaceae bacterium]